ncbi:MAG: polysaccharide biosynthesis tyrosine autokinase [Chthoniobacteraceae bacterium]
MEAQQSPSPSGDTGPRIGLRVYRYRAIIRRYWWVLVLCVSIGLIYEVSVLLSKPRRFASVGKLIVSETAADDVNRAVAMEMNWSGTIIAELQSPVVRDRAAKKTAVEKPHLEHLVPSVEISAINEPNTYIFSVKGAGPDPDFSRYFVDAVMAAFMEVRREDRRADMSGRITDLVKQTELEKAEVDASRATLERFMDDSSVPFIEQQAQQISTDLADLKRARDELLQQVNIYKNLNETGLLDANAPKPEKKGTSQPNDSLGNRWLDKQEQLALREAELKERSVFWKPAHPRLQQLQREVADLRLSIEVLKSEAAKNLVGVLRRLHAEIETKETAIKELEEKARQFSKVISKYTALKQEVERRETTYTQTRENLDKLRLSPKANEVLAVRQPASPPEIENKGIVRHLLTGLIGGLLLGIAILLLLDRSDDRLASSTEMIEQFNEAIVAQIPDVANSRTNNGLPLLQEEDERFMFAEAFRSLRSSLIFMPNQTELKTLIITSAIPNEGKSTLASNLALTMAAAGARVLLVDADLRRGDIAALFDTDGRRGLSNILRGEMNWNACIQKTRNPHLHVIPRGPTTNQSGELLLTPLLRNLLDEWKAAYDLVIFNTAPILATDDTPTIAPNFDGTLMVIRASFTSARLTRNALNALYQRQVNVIGLILNCVDTEMPDYHYYRYPKYYAA